MRIKKCYSEEYINECDNEDLCNSDNGVQSNVLNVVHCEVERKESTENNTVNVSLENSNDNNVSQSESNGTEKTYFENCLEKCRNDLIKPVLQNFDKEGLLIHFMAFMSMIANGQLSVANMAVL